VTYHKTNRDALIAVATELLAEDSFSHFNIGRVSERAGISRRTFFNYFKDRDELLTEVLKTLRVAHEKAMEEWSAGLPEGLSVEQRLDTIFRRILDIIRVPTWRGSAFIRLSGELADVADHPVHAVIAEAKRDHERWFERELSRESFVSVSELATQLTIVMTGLFQLQLVHRSAHLGDAVLSMIPRLLSSSRAASH